MRALLIAPISILPFVGCGESPPAAPAQKPETRETETPGKTTTDNPPADPLGSQENPVRCDMPDGERAYLDRLRCPDGSRVRYQRLGSFTSEASDNMLDGYRILCGERETTIYMDMYHPGHIENEPAEGFTIVK
jgi:hypothetical protein